MESKALLEAQYANRMTPARELQLREAAAEASDWAPDQFLIATPNRCSICRNTVRRCQCTVAA